MQLLGIRQHCSEKFNLIINLHQNCREVFDIDVFYQTGLIFNIDPAKAFVGCFSASASNALR
jgi:hypothetical protein